MSSSAATRRGPTNKYYCLMMFPYPSGDLHVGHGRNYIIGDALARYKMMEGANVLAPMGWDSFGLPAENAAIKNDIHPRDLDRAEHRRHEAAVLPVGRHVRLVARGRRPAVPEYYRWTQWIFVRLFKAGLAYREEASVNWCPSCKTVLANEQVVGGVCERCGSTVYLKKLAQWFFRIRKYADRLLADLDKLAELARARPRDAAELDRQKRGSRGLVPSRGNGRAARMLHDARRYDLRGDLHRHRGGSSPLRASS